jgi:cytochrome c oxidase assembly protein subunit 11
MFGFGYALVPLYKAICEALGINVLSLSERQGVADKGVATGNTQVDTAAPSRWSSTPMRAALGLQAGGHMQVHPGELTVMYEFRNVQDRTMAAQAIPATRPCRPARTSTSWSASASTSTRWSPARASSGRWCSSSTPSCPRT